MEKRIAQRSDLPSAGDGGTSDFLRIFRRCAEACRIPMYFVGGLLGLVVCYLFGTLWFMIQYKTGFVETLGMCVIPYIPLDLVKLVLAVLVGSQIRKILIKQDLLS